ncbi:MAG: hypothetical protein AAGH83_01970 [Pseudomonadota bacterium]
MPYYASWTRIEPDARSTDATADAGRAFCDPYWALGRQWWVGEWAGFDGGTPMTAEIDLRHDSITAAGTPLPELALASPPDAGVAGGWRTSLRLAREAINLVDAQLAQWDAIIATTPGAFSGNLKEAAETIRRALEELVEKFPASVPQRVSAKMRPRYLVDGYALLDHLRSGEPTPLGDVLRDFTSKYQALEIPRSAEAAQLPARFKLETGRTQGTLQTSDDQVISVDSAATPNVHWSDLRVEPREPGSSNTKVATRLARLRFEGASTPRFWQAQAPGTDYVAAGAGPADLGQLLAAALFAEQGGTRWIASWEVAAPALMSVTDVTVLDSFGRKHPLTAPREADLAGWSLDPKGQTMALLNAPQILSGPDIEDISLQIDELDNLMWAIEDVEIDSFGRGHRLPPGAPQPDVTVESYAARVTPTDNWTAYQRVEPRQMRKAILAPLTGRQRETSSLLSQSLFMAPESIGPLGRRVRTQWCLARDAAGQRYLWRVHRTALTRPRGGSGLAHDQTLRPFA